MKARLKQYKYNKQRLTQACVAGNREEFDFYRGTFSIEIMTDCIAFALRHGHIELAEYITTLYPEYIEKELFTYRRIGRIKKHNLVKIIKSINKKSETPNLFKIRKRFLNESIGRFWRGRNLEELIVCLNRLPREERKKQIDDYLNMRSSSDSIMKMKDGLQIFLREETINKILGV